MGKMKIGVERGEVFYFDAEKGRISNGKWALVWNWGKFEMADKILAGAMAVKKSFSCNRYSGRGIDFDDKIPDFDAVMKFDKSEHSPAHKTGWAYVMDWGLGYMIEYKTETGKKIYINSDYSNMLDKIGCAIYGKDGDSPIYSIEGDGTVCAVVMPIKGPEKKSCMDTTLLSRLEEAALKIMEGERWPERKGEYNDKTR
jgi:hypothetical protein